MSGHGRAHGRTRLALVFAVVAVIVATAVALVLLTRPDAAAQIAEQASSTAPGTDASLLVDVASDTSATPASEQDVQGREATWRSDGETDGAWIRLDWEQPTTVSRVRIDGAGDASGAYVDALVVFGDGSSVLVTADESGDVLVDVPRREVRSATVRFATFEEGATSVALRGLLIDDSGQHIGAPTGSTVTASAGDMDPSTVADGDLQAGVVGRSWRSSAPEADAWVEHRWEAPVAIASVQLAGTTTEAPDGGGWWDVPVSAVSHLDSTRAARATYEAHKATQRPLL